MPIYAHSVDSRPKSSWELLEDHALNVAQRAAQFGTPFAGNQVAFLLGLVHDLGKAKPEFQAKLAGEKNTASHSGEGAKLLNEKFQGLGPLLAACVAGHHSGLPDMEDLAQRLSTVSEPTLPEWMDLPDRLSPFGPLSNEASYFSLQFVIRMLFSCLTDADELETVAFYDALEGRSIQRAPAVVTTAHKIAFDNFMLKFEQSTGPVNDLRAEILSHTRMQTTQPTGLFSLTVPTGGGKTLASLGFAIDHALHHGLEQIIHVIPFTSIVEQTADVFGAVLGSDDVVEHHSSFDWDAIDDDEDQRRLRRVTRNWDAPVVVTTAVQFFESLFAARKRSCIKLHNLSRSVIVIDEAQTIPRKLLRPCLAAINELAQNYGATVVLSTATQPVVTRAQGLNVPEALENVRELAPNPTRLYKMLRRTNVTNAGPLDDMALVKKIRDAAQILTIVGNRKHARNLFQQVADLPGACHLSTTMTPRHRRHVLSEIRTRLKDGAPVRLISTSLIEAGVDVDFPVVMRAAAGIDSIAQAAGRCNREGKLRDKGHVIVFIPTAEDSSPPPETAQMAEIGAKILDTYDDPLSEDAVAAYFRALLWSQGPDALDAVTVGPKGGPQKTGIMRTIKEVGDHLRFPFAQIAEAFCVIDDTQAPVIIRGGVWGIPDDLLKDLMWREGTGGIARALQPYVVTLPRHTRHALEASRAASLWREDLFGREFLLLDHAQLYDDDAGLRMERFEDMGFMNG